MARREDAGEERFIRNIRKLENKAELGNLVPWNTYQV